MSDQESHVSVYDVSRFVNGLSGNHDPRVTLHGVTSLECSDAQHSFAMLPAEQPPDQQRLSQTIGPVRPSGGCKPYAAPGQLDSGIELPFVKSRVPGLS